MATPKFDRIAIEFAQRIGATFDSAFTPGSGAMPDADLLTADEIESFVNKSLLTLFSQIWQQTKANKKIFSDYVPELVKTADLTFSSSIYTIASPNKDFFIPLNGYISSTYVRVWDASKFAIAKTGYYDEYTASESNPALIYIGESQKLYIFPSTLTSATVVFLKQPLDPTTGDFLSQNGSYDSPFAEHWQNDIVSIAESLYSKAVAGTT